MVLADQISKGWVLKAITAGTLPAKITSFFNFIFVWNPGISFGLFSQRNDIVFLGLTFLTCLISLGFFVVMIKIRGSKISFCFALIIGGAVGNIIDRIRFRAVIDFLDFHAFGYHWPTFNLADSFIFIGASVWLMAQFLKARKDR